MKNFIRDSTIRSTITFRDNLGVPVIPTSANLTMSFIPLGGGDRTFVTYPLVAIGLPLGSSWQYDWDSRTAEPCTVYGHAESVGLTQRSTIDFEFRLTANRANKELAGDD